MKKNINPKIRHIYLIMLLLFCTSVLKAQTPPSITTDQLDYMPGTTVTLSGEGFLAGELITIIVNHTSGGDDLTSPAHAPFSVYAASDGSFIAQWYVPADEDEDGASLVATATGMTSSFVAQAFFTDNLNIDFRQAANNDAGYGPGAIHWISSILQQNNSVFTEGMSALQRILAADIPATTGNIHSLRISTEFTKGGHYAYDFLTGNSLGSYNGWNIAYADFNDYLIENGISAEDILVPYACGNELGPPASLASICESIHQPGSGFFFDVELPDDPFISVHGPVQDKIDAYEAIRGNRYARIYGNAPIINAYFTCVEHDVANQGDLSDSQVYYTLIIETASTNLLVELAGHLAISGLANEGLTWGPGHGAGDINGGPYHFRLHTMGGSVNPETCAMSEVISLGSQDNQIKAGDIIPLVCDCAINGDAGPICPGSTYTYCAPDSASSVVWSISGNATFVGSGTCVDVTAGAICDSSFTLVLDVTYQNGCMSECTITIVVQDTISPVITELPNESTINCPDTPVFAQATATDECDEEVSLTYTDEFIEGNCPGNYTVIRHWLAEDDCGNTAIASQTINVQDVTAPIIGQLPGEDTIECPNTPVFAQATATDECDEGVSLTYTDEFIEGNCLGNYTVIRHWLAEDDCGNTAIASQTINVQDVTAPIIGQLPGEDTIECPDTPVFAQATATDECDEEVSLTYTDEFIEGNCPGNYTLIRIWVAADDCGNVSTASQVIHVMDTTPPLVECPSEITSGDCNETFICLASASDECDGEFLPVTYNYACDFDFPVGTTIVVASAQDACGNSASCNFEVTIISNPVCLLVAPSPLPMAGSTNNSLCVNNDSGLTYVWSVSGIGWAITSGANTSCISYTAGSFGVEGTFSLIITNGFGCSDTCSVTFGSVGNQFCTYTQGFYGGNGKNCLGIKAIDVISNALLPVNGGNLVIGTPATTRVLTILSSEASCLNHKMPAGTTPASLPLSSGDVTCVSATGTNYLNNGRFKSVLVGQTIALGLNLRGDANLSGLELLGNQLTTAKTSSCVNGIALPYTEKTFCVPSNVWNYLSAPKTVAKLNALANECLGGNIPSGMTISDVSSAADAINRAFDRCRILVAFGTCDYRTAAYTGEETSNNANLIASEEKQLHLKTYPNPLSDEANFEIGSMDEAQASLEIFSATGERICTVFSGQLAAGEMRTLQFDAGKLPNGMYICKLTAGNAIEYDTIIVNK